MVHVNDISSASERLDSPARSGDSGSASCLSNQSLDLLSGNVPGRAANDASNRAMAKMGLADASSLLADFKTDDLMVRFQTPNEGIKNLLSPQRCDATAKPGGMAVLPDTGSDILPATRMPVLPDTGSDILPATRMPVLPDTGSDILPATRMPVLPDTGSDILPSTRMPVLPDTGSDIGPGRNGARTPVLPDTGSDILPGTSKPADRTPTQREPLGPLPFEGWDIQRLDPNLKNRRLGCADAISHALNALDPSIKVTNNTRALDRDLRQNGYNQAEYDRSRPIAEQLQPGDVIIGYRPDGMPGHAAIYKGNGQIFENNSDTGRIIGNGDVRSFDRGMHNANGSFNKNGFDRVVILRRGESAITN